MESEILNVNTNLEKEFSEENLSDTTYEESEEPEEPKPIKQPGDKQIEKKKSVVLEEAAKSKPESDDKQTNPPASNQPAGKDSAPETASTKTEEKPATSDSGKKESNASTEQAGATIEEQSPPGAKDEEAGPPVPKLLKRSSSVVIENRAPTPKGVNPQDAVSPIKPQTPNHLNLGSLPTADPQPQTIVAADPSPPKSPDPAQEKKPELPTIVEVSEDHKPVPKLKSMASFCELPNARLTSNQIAIQHLRKLYPAEIQSLISQNETSILELFEFISKDIQNIIISKI